MHESAKKVGLNIWQICCKAVILHPLSRGKRDEVEMLKTGDEVRTSTIGKKFSKKLEKVLAVQKNALPLHPLSERKPFKEEFFERFRYKQASSTSFVWNMTKNRNRQYLKQVEKTDSVLEQIKTSLNGET